MCLFGRELREACVLFVLFSVLCCLGRLVLFFTGFVLFDVWRLLVLFFCFTDVCVLLGEVWWVWLVHWLCVCTLVQVVCFSGSFVCLVVFVWFEWRLLPSLVD